MPANEGTASGAWALTAGGKLPYALPWVLGFTGAVGETPIHVNSGTGGGAYTWEQGSGDVPHTVPWTVGLPFSGALGYAPDLTAAHHGHVHGATYGWRPAGGGVPHPVPWTVGLPISGAVGQSTVLGVGHSSGVWGWHADTVGWLTVQYFFPPPPTPPRPDVVISPQQLVSVHSFDGVQLYQFLPESQIQVVWNRTLQDVSRCEVQVPWTPEDERLPDITPWLHWVSVWDETPSLLWTGPIQKVTSGHTAITISARDVAAFMARTRVSLTKRWDATDLTAIAGELWRAMIENHSLPVHPVVRNDPDNDPFDFAVEADAAMLDAKMNELVGLGLQWTVAAGVPIIGPVNMEPVVALGENDFVGGSIEVTRDGAQTFNDVVVRAADSITRTRIPMAGLNLQTLVHLDSMFGVSNASRAAGQYVRYYGGVRTRLSMPSGLTLQPFAPVGIDQLIPSARFVVEAYGLAALMKLTDVEVSGDATGSEVKVTLESVFELPELAEPGVSVLNVGAH